jgi:DNA-binding NarL/FixJ family response regulator
LIRVLLADDQPLVRAGFAMILDAEDDIEVVGQADDGVGAVALARALRPDVTLMDVRMPLLDGVAATRELARDGLRVLILTTFELDEYVFDGLRAGASGFLVKHAGPADLLRGVREVAAGNVLLSPGVSRRLVDEFVSRPVIGRVAGSKLLTDREREVVALVGLGLSNEEIAAELVISPATARTHVSRSMIKLRARDRAQLVVFAFRTGLVTGPGVG